MEIKDIQTPQDILKYMDNISYGWIDINNEQHIQTMKNFRQLYRISSLEESINNKIGTCIEQVNIMRYLLDLIKIPNKMFCCRIFEPDNYVGTGEEHMHCFILYYLNNKVYQIEHPNPEKVGIYEYDNEDEALNTIIDYYVKRTGGTPRPTAQFHEVPVGISFKEFNAYINHLNQIR